MAFPIRVGGVGGGRGIWGALPGRHFSAIAAVNGTYPRKPVEAACPSIRASPWMLSGECGKCQKRRMRRNFRHFEGKYLGVSALPYGQFYLFFLCPVRAGGPSPEGISVCLRLKRYVFLATPRGRVSIYTNIDGAPGGISGKCRKCRNLRHFGGVLMGGFVTFLGPAWPVFYRVSA